MSEHGRLCTFSVDGLLLGIWIEHVVELLRDQPVTAVPLAPHSVAGLLNLRGQVVTAIDARHRLGLPAGPTPSVSMVLRSGGEAVSLLVDREGEVFDVDASMAVDLPDSAGETLRAFASGAYCVEGQLVLVLDHETTLAVAS